MKTRSIVVLCLLIAAPLPLAGASTSDTWVSLGHIDRLNPEFTLGGDVRVTVEYWASCSRACQGTEWRLFVDLPWRGSEVPDAELPAGIAGGAHGFDAGKTYVAHVVETTISAAGLAPGGHILSVATRAAGADTWRMSWGTYLEVLHPGDWDADGIPDSLEPRLCLEETSSLAMLAVRDSCPTWGDVDLQGRALVLDLPRFVEHEDMNDWHDRDGYLRSVALQMTRLNLVPGIALADMVQPGEEHVVPIDVVDDRRATALELCARIPVITAFAWGPDADGDGWPERGSFALGKVCDDPRHDREPRIVTVTDVFGARVDFDDQDPEVAHEEAYEPFYYGIHASFGPDADADGVPLDSLLTYASVTFDPARTVPMAATYETFRTRLDLDDGNRDMPVLFSPLEHDGDAVPEHAEPYLCARDDPFTPEDGTCTIEGRYTPPEIFTSRFEAPRLLADDDLDILPDGIEAAACDAQARIGGDLIPCYSYDVNTTTW